MLSQIFNDITIEILSTVTSDFLKQIIFLKSFDSVLYMLNGKLKFISELSSKPILILNILM